MNGVCISSVVMDKLNKGRTTKTQSLSKRSVCFELAIYFMSGSVKKFSLETVIRVSNSLFDLFV
jgi:hypothetical protein